MRGVNKVKTAILLLILVLLVIGCVEDETPTKGTTNQPSTTSYPTTTPHQETIPSLDYQSDTSAIISELSLKGYTVHNVDFAKNKNGVYVLTAMIDTKGNYDNEVLDTYKIMYKNGVADYYVVGIADYEIQSSWSFTVKKNILDDFSQEELLRMNT